MKAKMLVQTRFNGETLKKGASVNVPAVVAKRWDAAGIAKSAGEATPAVDPLTGEPGGEKPLDRMTTAELEAKAAELGVDISAAGTNKERAEIIEDFINLPDLDEEE